MRVTPVEIPGVWVFEPTVFPDARGSFAAPFQEDVFRQVVGRPLRVEQTNLSHTRAGAVRGVHFADTPPGQAKYVYAGSGILMDVIVDLRVGSPAFGEYAAVRLDAAAGTAVYLPEGVGHLVVGIAPMSTLMYLCSRSYDPAAEHGISPLDPSLGLPLDEWLGEAGVEEAIVSDKDRAAPPLAWARETGILPEFDVCTAWYRELAHEDD